MEGPEEGAVAQIFDHHPVELGAEALDQRLHQVVRQRPRRGDAVQLERDRLRLERADPDGQLATRPSLLDETDDRRAACLVDPQVPYLDLDGGRQRPPGERGESEDSATHLGRILARR